MPFLTSVRHPAGLQTLGARRLILCLNYSEVHVVVVTCAEHFPKRNGYALYMQTKQTTFT
jgi:hypothetical protein